MIDIHCHILPSVDDGSDSLQTSMLMAAIAADHGSTAVIATPHIDWDENFTDERWKKHRIAAAQFQCALTESKIPLHCFLGAEVLCRQPADTLLQQGLFPRIENTPYSLVEFDFEASVSEMEKMLKLLIQHGIHPILAHPERYPSIRKHKDVIGTWMALGVHTQINAGSLFGDFGHKAYRFARWLLDQNCVSLVATDAHDVYGRPPILSHAYDYIEKRYGQSTAQRLTMDNPKQILADMIEKP